MPDEQRQPRRRNQEYLGYIRTLPCAICGDTTSVEAAHLRIGSINDGKRYTGMAEKSSDKWAVPLCGRHHRQQHDMNEREFWASYGIDPFALSLRYQTPLVLNYIMP
jgi:hypothetical protein